MPSAAALPQNGLCVTSCPPRSGGAWPAASMPLTPTACSGGLKWAVRGCRWRQRHAWVGAWRADAGAVVPSPRRDRRKGNGFGRGEGTPAVPKPRPAGRPARGARLQVEVQLELVRVRAEPDRVELAGTLVFQPGVDQVLSEDPAVEQ